MLKVNRPYIIGEIGINHNGDIELAKKLIDVAVEAKVHYETYGYMRKKAYKIPKWFIPKDFDWIAYTELNTDVKQIFVFKQ